MISLERVVRTAAVALSIAACSTPPSQVTSAGPSLDTGDSTASSTGPTTEASATEASADGTTTTGTGTDATTTPLDDTATTTDPSTTSEATSTGEPTTTGMETTTGEPTDCHPLLVEAFYDSPGGNNGNQWIELYNPCPEELTLTDTYSLGWGGADYTSASLDLLGAIESGECFVVGGPNSDDGNANPVYDQTANFSGDLQLGGADADGIALFFGTAASVTPTTIPVDAVIYGDANTSGLLDANGDAPSPHVDAAGESESIRRTSEMPTWVVEADPMPNDCPPF